MESWPLYSFLTLNLRTSESLSDIVRAKSSYEDDDALLMMALLGVRKSKLSSRYNYSKKIEFPSSASSVLKKRKI